MKSHGESANVASCADNAGNQAGLVVMVDMPLFDTILTDGASATTGLNHSAIIGHLQTELGLQVSDAIFAGGGIEPTILVPPDHSVTKGTNMPIGFVAGVLKLGS